MAEFPESDQASHEDEKVPQSEGRGWFNRFLKFVEWLGNLLPHPVTLFALFALGVVLVSGVAGYFDLSVEDPRPEGSAGRAPDGRIFAISLMNGDGLRRIVQNLVSNFTGFAPLGTVLVALLGVGVAEKSGLIRAGIRGIVLAAAFAGVSGGYTPTPASSSTPRSSAAWSRSSSSASSSRASCVAGSPGA